MTNELAVRENGHITLASGFLMPIAQVQEAQARRELLKSFAANVMTDGTDYGKIPGAGDKKNLLKPGAEKLCSFFGLVPDYPIETAILDFDGSTVGNGEPLIYYRIRCDLYRDGNKVGSGLGSCSSRETKYRYRSAQRTCPSCGKQAIYASKEGDGYFCWKKFDGCGKKFAKGDRSIESQEQGKVLNTDIFDLDNTILKMAKKRALIDATLVATNVSDHFTQDLDEYVESYATVIAPEPEPLITETQLKHLHAVGTEVYGKDWDDKRHELVGRITRGRTESSNDLTEAQAQKLIDGISEKRKTVVQAATGKKTVENGKDAAKVQAAILDPHSVETAGEVII